MSTLLAQRGQLGVIIQANLRRPGGSTVSRHRTLPTLGTTPPACTPG